MPNRCHNENISYINHRAFHFSFLIRSLYLDLSMLLSLFNIPLTCSLYLGVSFNEAGQHCSDSHTHQLVSKLPHISALFQGIAY